jgi:hypothetical protein
MSNGLQLSLPSWVRPSLPRTQASGSPRNSVSRVAGVRLRIAVASATLNPVVGDMTS